MKARDILGRVGKGKPRILSGDTTCGNAPCDGSTPSTPCLSCDNGNRLAIGWKCDVCGVVNKGQETNMSKCTKCGTNFVGAPENPPGPGLCKYCEIEKLYARVADLEKQIKQIYDVATGQEQVAFDDTLAMAWIAEYITEQGKIP